MNFQGALSNNGTLFLAIRPDLERGNGGQTHASGLFHSRTYRLRWSESLFSALSNFAATAGVLKSPVRISRLLESWP